MDRTAPGARAVPRGLAVLAVLLGLLAMHGLASTHHAAAAAPVKHGAGEHLAAPTAPEHHHQQGVPTVVHGAVAVAAPDGPGCDDDCPDLAVLCVAVLVGAALLATLLARRRAPLLGTPPRHDRADRAPPARVARPPDPVRDLCVSRT